MLSSLVREELQIPTQSMDVYEGHPVNDLRKCSLSL